MKLFIDTANVDQIREATESGVTAELQQTLHSLQKEAEILLK